MNSLITFLNTTGKSFVDFSASMLIQSSVLIIVLLVLDAFLHKKVRVVVLYGIWMLLLVKLVLPTTLSSPIGLGYWIGDKVPSIVTEKVSFISKQIESSLQRTKPVSQTLPYGIKTTDLSLIGTPPELMAETSAKFPVAASKATASLSWQGFVFLGWLAVVISMIVLLIRRMFVVRCLLAKSKKPNDSMLDIFECCREQIGVHRPVVLELSPVVVSPSVCGIFRPRILIPQDLPGKLKKDALRSVLLHELAHIKRGDVWISMIQTILQIAYFYNPLLWVANVIIRKVREQAVDEMVLVAMGEKAEDYPETLLNISRMTFGRPALNLRLIGIVESKKALERRIMIMLSRPVPKSSKLGICRLIAIVIIGAVILPMGYNPAERTALAASFMEDRSEGGIIIPGVRVGDYTLGMSKDDVLRKLGEPKGIFYEGEKYTLDNLPRSYYMSFGDISFCIHDDAVIEIGVHSPLYKFTNGLRVGDSEQKVKKALGNNFRIRESERKDYLSYKDEGLMFEIHKQDRTVMEIGISRTRGGRGERGAPDQQEKSKHTIVPGLRVGEYTLGMRKDEVLEELGEPEAIYLDEDGDEVIHRGEENYNLNNLPSECLMIYSDISFGIEEDSVEVIMVRSPGYKLSNGLAVGELEQKVKQAFGKDFEIEDALGKVFRCYHDRGLAFQIHEKSQTVAEIVVYKPEGDRGGRDAPAQQQHSKHTIIPGLRVGDYTFDMSKDEVLRKLGEPKEIFYGGERYTLDNLPRHYYMFFGDVSFRIKDDSVKEITVASPSYKFTNGLGVGDSEQKIKKAFGDDFNYNGADFLAYQDKGLSFEINNEDRTVEEINVSQITNDHGERDAPDQQEQSKHTIVPGVRVGVYTFDMSKDEVLRKLGEPDSIQLEEDEVIHRGEEKYTLNNLPREYIMAFGDVSFFIHEDSVKAIFVRSPLYKLSNGLKVGDSEQKIKQAFGEDFHLEESLGKDYLCYDAKWLAFEINKKNQTIAEIVTFQPKVDRPDSAQVALVRKAASEGRILYKVTTPDEFKEIAGQPTREWTDGDDVIYMEYPGIEVKFVCRGNSPYVVIYVLCNRMGIDIGQDRPIDERDLDQQSGYRSSQDLTSLVRQAAADGRISYKLTTPDEFKAIAGRPTREWMDGDNLVCMEYPGIEVKFFGNQDIETPHTLVNLSCEGGEIDFGQNRPVVPRNEGDLDKFGTFWGYSGVDLSRLDLSQKGELLKKMPFDNSTVWPESDRLPPDFDPRAVMEWGKYPGLRVKQLHDQGITGKGVHVAIIDQPLLLGHIEYRDQLVSYKEIETGNADPQMHGPPVASILVGKTCGVAPEAILHYWAEPSWKRDYKYRCMALEQIIQFNKGKEKSEQIRVVSISKGFSPSEPNLDRWKTLLEKAKKSGIYLVHCGSMGFGAGCRFMKDSDNPANYRLCAFYRGGGIYGESGTFFTPIDHRTTASAKARDAYTFWTRSGLSWGAPYYAGVVTLGIQVNPDLRPEQIDKLLYDSGWDFQRGKLINPVGFVKAARAVGADGQ